MLGSDNLDVFVRTVSATPKEYISGLKQAVPGGIVADGHEINVRDGAVAIHIQIEILRSAKIEEIFKFKRNALENPKSRRTYDCKISSLCDRPDGHNQTRDRNGFSHLIANTLSTTS